MFSIFSRDPTNNIRKLNYSCTGMRCIEIGIRKGTRTEIKRAIVGAFLWSHLDELQYNGPCQGHQNRSLYQLLHLACTSPVFTLYNNSVVLLLHYFCLHTSTSQITFRRSKEVKGHCTKQPVIYEGLPALTARIVLFTKTRGTVSFLKCHTWPKASAEPGPTLLRETSTTSATAGKMMIRFLNLFPSAGPSFSTCAVSPWTARHPVSGCRQWRKRHCYRAGHLFCWL